MSLAISVENVSKVYRLGEITRRQLFEDIKSGVQNAMQRSASFLRGTDSCEPSRQGSSDFFWALKDISFEIKTGETVGLIGRNGAGKSTLLKLLSRITAPTRGNIRINGRLATMLEVGTGFHSELTGRDNVYLSGTIMGMNRHEIRAKFDEIVAFAGLEQFIDTPVKRYSSGMMVRLGFSVAAHLEPEIFILDEVLAVGDQQFHNQCIDRIKEIVNGGRTVILVSHNMSYIRRLSQRTIWLQKGGLVEYGPTEEVVNHYEAVSSSSAGSRTSHDSEKRASVLSWRLDEGVGGEPNILARSGSACSLEFTLHADEPLRQCRFQFKISDVDDVPIYINVFQIPNIKAGTSKLYISLPSLPLQPGQYRLETHLFQRHEEVDHWQCNPALVVSGEGLLGEQPQQGVLRMESTVRVGT